MKNIQVNVQLAEYKKNKHISLVDSPTNPIQVSDSSNIGIQESKEIVRRYFEHGFVVLELLRGDYEPKELIQLGLTLKMGMPFVPPLYSNGDYRSHMVCKVSVENDLSEPSHPSFQRAVGLDLHVDGTLQKIGLVKSSMLLCKSPAAKGGYTTIFNSSGAFSEIIEKDPAAAKALMTHGVLVRQANINNCQDINSGPAFQIQNGEIIAAYSISQTDSFVTVKGVNEADLQRGINLMKNLSAPNGKYFTKVRLLKGHVLIIANTKVCHGRTPYYDNDKYHRCLFRGLYLRYPRVIEQKLKAVT